MTGVPSASLIRSESFSWISTLRNTEEESLSLFVAYCTKSAQAVMTTTAVAIQIGRRSGSFGSSRIVRDCCREGEFGGGIGDESAGAGVVEGEFEYALVRGEGSLLLSRQREHIDEEADEIPGARRARTKPVAEALAGLSALASVVGALPAIALISD